MSLHVSNVIERLTTNFLAKLNVRSYIDVSACAYVSNKLGAYLSWRSCECFSSLLVRVTKRARGCAVAESWRAPRVLSALRRPTHRPLSNAELRVHQGLPGLRWLHTR